MLLRLLILGGAVFLAACANERLAYVGKHPEMPAAHRQILTTGTMPDGTAVAGMTRDEVRLAMQGPPATFDKILGEEAWIYLRKKTTLTAFPEDRKESTGAITGRPTDLRAAADSGFVPDGNLKTTIFFQGDRATHAEVTTEKP